MFTKLIAGSPRPRTATGNLRIHGGELMKKQREQKTTLKPLSPIQVKTQLAAAKELYEGGDASIFTPEWYENTKKRILENSANSPHGVKHANKLQIRLKILTPR